MLRSVWGTIMFIVFLALIIFCSHKLRSHQLRCHHLCSHQLSLDYTFFSSHPLHWNSRHGLPTDPPAFLDIWSALEKTKLHLPLEIEMQNVRTNIYNKQTRIQLNGVAMQTIFIWIFGHCCSNADKDLLTAFPDIWSALEKTKLHLLLDLELNLLNSWADFKSLL